jgi:hypothetical protein
MFSTLLNSAMMQIEKEEIARSLAKQEARRTKRAAREADVGRREREPRSWFRAVHRA